MSVNTQTKRVNQMANIIVFPLALLRGDVFDLLALGRSQIMVILDHSKIKVFPFDIGSACTRPPSRP